MKNNLKILAVAMIMALLLAMAAAPLLAESGSGSEGSSDSPDLSSNDGSGSSEGSGSSDASSGGSSGSSEDKTSDRVKADVKDNEAKVEVRSGDDRLKAEVKAKDDKKAEVKVKAETKNGFAGVFSRLMSFLFGKNKKAAEQLTADVQKANDKLVAGQAQQVEDATQKAVDAAAGKETVSTPAPGITIDKSLSSGPGYPTGPLDIMLPATQLLLDRVGLVKGNEIKDRQYEVEFAAVPVTINGAPYTATEVKVISNLKGGKHQGTMDFDFDVPLGSTLPAGHITLQYSGSAIVSGSTIASGGVFKTSKMTGVFAGLVSDGTYSMSISGTGSTFGSPAIVSITTTSNI